MSTPVPQQSTEGTGETTKTEDRPAFKVDSNGKHLYLCTDCGDYHTDESDFDSEDESDSEDETTPDVKVETKIVDEASH